MAADGKSAEVCGRTAPLEQSLGFEGSDFRNSAMRSTIRRGNSASYATSLVRLARAFLYTEA